MDIKLYDFEFNLLGVENKYQSLNSEIYYNDVGKLEIHLPLSSPLLPVVMDNRYLVAKYGNKTAVITGMSAINELVIYGRSCSWLLKKRTVPAFSMENPVEGISLGVNLEDTARSIAAYSFSDVENFRLGDICGITDNTAFWRNVRNVSFDVIKDIMDVCGGGFRFDFNVSQKTWEFACLYGKTLDFVISEAHRNAYDTEYVRDILNYQSCGYYDEAQENEDGTSGESVEKYITKTEKSGIYRFEGILSATSESEAVTELRKNAANETIRAKFRELTYGKDYGLGDIVRIRIDKGDFRETVRRRIIGVKQNYDENGYSEQPILKEEEVLSE